MKKSLSELKKILDSVLSEKEIIIDSITYENRNNYNVLTITLDKIGGIDLDTIVEATKIINPYVDDYDFTDDAYILDVISKERGGK